MRTRRSSSLGNAWNALISRLRMDLRRLDRRLGAATRMRRSPVNRLTQTTAPMTDPLRLQFGAFTLDVSERLLLRGGQPVPLAPKAFDVLAALAARHGHLVTKDELLKEVWPDTFVEESNLAYHVFALRRALGEADDGQKYVETVPKKGYRFVAVVTPVTRSWAPRDLRNDGGRLDIPREMAAAGVGKSEQPDRRVNPSLIQPLATRTALSKRARLSRSLLVAPCFGSRPEQGPR